MNVLIILKGYVSGQFGDEMSLTSFLPKVTVELIVVTEISKKTGLGLNLIQGGRRIEEQPFGFNGLG